VHAERPQLRTVLSFDGGGIADVVAAGAGMDEDEVGARAAAVAPA
jgi:hypothetical protein